MGVKLVRGEAIRWWQELGLLRIAAKDREMHGVR
jgi:hypothetical protein